LMDESFVEKLDDYCKQIHNGAEHGSNGSKVMFGFMLSTWLQNKITGSMVNEKTKYSSYST